MSKRKTPAPARDRRILVPLSAAEFQLIDYAASKSNIRGTLAWMRAKLLDAAKARLSDEVVEQILEGRATMALMRESLGESKPRQAETPPEEPVSEAKPPERPKLELVRSRGSRPASGRSRRAPKPRSRR